MKTIVLYVLLFTTLYSSGQVSWPETYVVSKDSLNYQPMAQKYWDYIDLGKDSVSLATIISPEYAARFKPFEKIKLSVNIGSGTNVWLRYRLKNDAAQPLTITLDSNSDTHLYVLEGNEKLHFRSGYRVPWSQRTGMKQFGYIVYEVPANSEVAVYVFHKNARSLTGINPQVRNYKNIVQTFLHDHFSYSVNETMDMFFCGFIVFAMVFNLLFYYINRERVYIVYSITLLFAALNAASDVIGTEFFSENPVGADTFVDVISLILMLLIIHTIRFFFRIWQYYPRWDNVLLWLPPILVAGGMLLAQFEGVNDYVVKAFGIICIISGLVILTAIIVMVIAFLRKNHKGATLFVAATLPFLITVILKIFSFNDRGMFYSGVWAILLLSWVLFSRYKGLQIEHARVALEKEEERNRLIAQQNELLEKQVAERTAELTQSLSELKLTQNQLIQSEKMASLGELTAGIAHEIQNPLNFVNNFSDVSVELLEELKEEADKGDLEEVKAIADDVMQNLGKIAHHGRRADGIVKGMLQHSRASSGQKEPTDINALADEYLRLAYHGLRAKDKSFNAELVMDFDEKLPKVNAIPQDLGRVLLNLFTNAFYATEEKKKSPPTPEGGETRQYKPTVTVITKQSGNSVEIIVKDNGTGIPDSIKDKILQPFFTTKPTGEGTGLGLSLSYDIVVKGHGGSIAVESVEGKGAEFTIKMPLK